MADSSQELDGWVKELDATIRRSAPSPIIERLQARARLTRALMRRLTARACPPAEEGSENHKLDHFPAILRATNRCQLREQCSPSRADGRTRLASRRCLQQPRLLLHTGKLAATHECMRTHTLMCLLTCRHTCRQHTCISTHYISPSRLSIPSSFVCDVHWFA